MHYSEYEGIELTTMANRSSGGGVIGVERPVTCNLPDLKYCFDPVLTSGLGIIGMDRMETEYMSRAQHTHDAVFGRVCS